MVDLRESLKPAGTASPPPVSEIAAKVQIRKRRKRVSAAGALVATMGIAVFAISTIPEQKTNTATVADGGETETIPASSLPDDRTGSDVDNPVISVPATDEHDGPSPTDEPAGSKSSASSEAVETDTTSDLSQGSEPGTGSTNETTEDSLPVEPDPVTTPGIRIKTTTTSEWAGGRCIQMEITNDADTALDWQVVLDLGGEIDTLWNAAADKTDSGLFIFSGLDEYNSVVQPGATTSFGACVDDITQ